MFIIVGAYVLSLPSQNCISNGGVGQICTSNPTGILGGVFILFGIISIIVGIVVWMVLSYS
jgi:hypothetical protein